MNIVVIVLSVIANFILYLSFGSLLTGRKGRGGPGWLLMSVTVGFFFYYFVFFIFCLPPMKYYRPLSMLTKIWVPTIIVFVILSAMLNIRNWLSGFKSLGGYVKVHPYVTAVLLLFTGVQIVLVAFTYNFTLDAAYYVANVATSVETNMMNVYDPFTGAWQDHYEMRYFFATYQMQDAVVCQLTGIPALIWTKTVMAVTVIILTNIVYFLIARELFTENGEGNRDIKTVVMMIFMFVINLTFITIYTSSLFLMTRTYEGKAIVGNLAIATVFYLFVKMNDDSLDVRPWLMVFITCFGAATISSSANMLLPVELTVLFLPMIIRKKRWGMLFKYAACLVPGVVFSLIFVLYVKGYFVWYTFPK